MAKSPGQGQDSSATGTTLLRVLLAITAAALVWVMGLPEFLTGGVSAVKWTPHTLSRRFPHDSGAFTQGLSYHEGKLIETTGMYGKSVLRRVDPLDGKVLQEVELGAAYFGEGSTVVGDKIVVLTWREQTGFVYDLNTFEKLDTFRFTTTRNEGWGIAYDKQNHQLIVSDGSEYLHFWDADSKIELRRVKVVDHEDLPIRMLNELEMMGDELLANIWQSDLIARINYHSGKLIGYIDASELHQPRTKGEDVFNGIAYDANLKDLYVTGKYWTALYMLNKAEAGL